MMNQRICPDCHTKTMSFTEYCTKCGADLHQALQRTRKHGRNN